MAAQLQLTITWMPKIIDVATVMVLHSYTLRYWRTDRRHGQSRHNPNLSDRWVTKFSKVWGSARASSGAGKHNGIYHVKIVYHTMNSF